MPGLTDSIWSTGGFGVGFFGGEGSMGERLKRGAYYAGGAYALKKGFQSPLVKTGKAILYNKLLQTFQSKPADLLGRLSRSTLLKIIEEIRQ